MLQYVSTHAYMERNSGNASQKGIQSYPDKFLSQMDYFSLAGHIFASFLAIHLTINNVREFLGFQNKIMTNLSVGQASTAYIGLKSSVRPDKSDS